VLGHALVTDLMATLRDRIQQSEVQDQSDGQEQEQQQ
jgi:hypothetical protein